MYFKLDALASWEGVVPNEVLAFDAPDARRIRLAIMSNADVEVWASFPVDPVVEVPSGEVVNADPEMRDVLIGFGSGQFETEFTTRGQTLVRILAPEDASIFVRGFAPDMRVAESDGEIFTSVMPRERRNTEFDRMVMWSKLNEARREAQWQEALAALRAGASAPVEPVAAPAAIQEGEADA